MPIWNAHLPIVLTADVSGTLPIANGGTAATSLTAGSYTPTLAGITIGNGSVVATYLQIGKFCIYQIKVTWGTTTSSSGNVTITLPVAAQNAASATGCNYSYGNDVSANTSYIMRAVETDASTLLMCYGTTTNSPISSTQPFTWANTDWWITTGCYFTV